MVWLSQHGASLEHRYRQTELWANLSMLIWQRAWQLAAEPGMAEAIAAAYATGVEHHEYFSVKGASDEARLEVLKILLISYYKTVNWVNIGFAYSQQDALIGEANWDGLFPLLYSRLSASQRGWLARVLRRLLVDTMLAGQVEVYCQRYEQFLTAARRYTSVRVVWREWFKPMVLGSKEAKKDRKNWLQRKKYEQKDDWKKKNRRRMALRKTGRQARFMRQLVGCDVDRDCRQWKHFLDELQLDKTAKNHYRQNVDPGQSKRWGRLAPKLKEKALDRLWEFIGKYAVPPVSWYGPGNRTTLWAEVFREGLVLLLSQREQLIRSQPPEFWQNLAPFLVWFDESAHEGIRYELLHLAATYAPRQVDSAIMLSMDMRDTREHGSLNRFKDWYQWVPAARFPALLLEGIESGVWNEDISAQVLVDMLEVDYAPAWEYVQELLSKSAGQVIERPRLAISVFGSLLFRKSNHLPNAWQYWEWLCNHLEIARAVIAAKVSHPMPGEFTYLAGLLEEELASLALWLTRAFDLLPTDVDDWSNNPRGPYAGLRTAIATELAGRGTTTAWRLLEELSEQLNRPYWVRIRLDQVRENLRRNAWEPASPEALIEMSQQADKRLIKSATDLQELVLDSLRRFQADLHNELAVANTLWIPRKQGNKQVGHEVRDENFLSDVLRFYLDRDLRRLEVLIKREVEIRKSIGVGTGQRTDLYIDAFLRDKTGDKTEVVTVVIEVKLAKNKETETALEEQLLPYLADQPYKHGIYLIGWHYGEYDTLPASKKDLPTIHQLLKIQTASVTNNYSIRTLILDIRLPADAARNKDATNLFEAM